jgi:iron complex transport system ATP-binding protein
MLEICNISYSVKQQVLLSNISFKLQRGLISGILGPNGAGKSTLLKIIIGEQRADCGQLLFDNKLFSSYPRHTLAQKIAMVSQNEIINSELTVIEYILLGRLAYSYSGYIEDDYTKVLNTMQKLEIENFRTRKYCNLSGGERSRVQLARALVQLDNKDGYDGYLLLDEFDANMDIYHQQMSIKLLTHLVEKYKLGILIIAHDLNFALNFFDNCILIKNGQIQSAGTPLEVLTPENISSVFNINSRIIQSGNHFLLDYW